MPTKLSAVATANAQNARLGQLAKTDPKSPNELVVSVPEGKSRERALADLAVGGIITNASVAARFLQDELPSGICIHQVALAMVEHGKKVNSGDLAAIESMLAAQVSALNSIFGEMTRRAALNMGTHMDVTERYMRLALKAQSQCRATGETLAAMKNPPVVIAKQANFAAGHQQVNNGPENRPVTEPANPAHTHEKQPRPIKQLRRTNG